MDLNYTDLGYFIDQLSRASLQYGFSAQDSSTFSIHMNSLYNVRCAPPVNNQLLSLCLDESCPLAQPSADCSNYVDLSPDGLENGTVKPAAVPTIPSSPDAESTSNTTAGSASSTIAAASDGLSGGGIAGITIGAVLLLLAGAGAIAFYHKRKNKPTITPFSPPGYATPSYQASSVGTPPSSVDEQFSPYVALQGTPWNQAWTAHNYPISPRWILQGTRWEVRK